ncbi:MAG: CotH kinase family protein [Melioribacteraceae bacterium]|nr:CotH kinase family protein [Melioribacteraceae bacterium]MCF8264598.1 CotH kinase family protein [Melioribacteraceae bacterium]
MKLVLGKMRTYFLIGYFAVFSLASAQSIIINEVSSSNADLINDEDGDDPDWIEIYNSSTNPIDVSNYFLSDSKTKIDKWQFPSLILNPHEYRIVFASGKSTNNSVVHWETIIDEGENWSYLIPTSEPPTNWNNLGFNDAAWSSGPTGIGYGDNDDNTVIRSALSVFGRKAFTIEDTSDIGRILFHIDFDDAFVAYLNGIEIGRANLGLPGSPVAYNRIPSSDREAQLYNGGKANVYEVPKELLYVGNNVLAVQVHNISMNSSDLSMIPFLTLGLTEKPADGKGSSSKLDLLSDQLHTNFKLKAEGDDLYLSRGSQIIDSMILPNLPVNVSFGRHVNNSDSLVIFSNPTPGAQNSGDSFPAISPNVEFSSPGGVYINSISITLSTNSAADIYITSDGSEPTKNSQKYSHPLNISSTVVVKAKAFTDGFMPGATTVNTYVLNQNHKLPIVSITTEPSNLWDYNSGIYVLGPNAESKDPNFGANFWQDWEKPANIEFFHNGNQEFSVGCGLKIFGAWSRANAQKSLALHFRNEYGTSTLEYQMFPDLPINKFESLVLRNSGNDWLETMLRDGLMQNISKGTGVDAMAFRPAVLYLNGEYWGIQNIREKINEDFLASHHDIDPQRVDILEFQSDVVEGFSDEYNQLYNYISSNSMSVSSNYEYVKSQIDIENFISYQLLNIYYDNTDWPGNNIKFWKAWDGDSRWRWILFDLDFGFGLFNSGRYTNNTLEFATEANGPGWPNPPWSTLLLRKLLENSEFKNQFILRAADLANTNLSSERATDILDSLAGLVRPEISNHANRWGMFSKANWETRINQLRNFAQNRTIYFRIFFQNYFGISGTSPVNFKNNNIEGGVIKANSLLITEEDWNGLFFNNIELPIKAVAKPGYSFIGWSGISTKSETIVINPATTNSVTANFRKWDGENETIVINEINYNSSADFNTEDWIELYNNSNSDIDLSEWVIKDSQEHEFIIPTNSVMKPDEYLVLVEDQILFESKFTSVKNIIGNIQFGFSGGGETIYLINDIGLVIDSVEYDDVNPWPNEADGYGATLELIHPDLDNNLPVSWERSNENGSPGERNGVYSSVSNNQSVTLIDNLYPNYPNPFNPTTKFRYSLAERGNVILELYDLLGRKVKTILNEELDAGIHTGTIDMTNNSSGVYFLFFKTPKTQQLNKLLLLK